MGTDPGYKVFFFVVVLYFFLKTRFHYVALGLEVSVSFRDPSATASPSAGFKACATKPGIAYKL